MREFSDYHKVKNLKNIEDYIKFYERAGIQKFVDTIRAAGALINPYDEREEENELMIREIRNYLQKNEETAVCIWDNLVGEAEIINSMYRDLFEMDLYKEAESVPAEKAAASFIVILEKYLRFFINEIESNGAENYKLRCEFHTDFAFKNNMSHKEKFMNMYDHMIYVADMVLKYLLFYKCKGIEQDLKTTDEYQNKSFLHLQAADQKSVIQKIEQEWRFFNRVVTMDQCCVNSYCNSREFLDFHIVNNRLENRKKKILNDLVIGEDASGTISREEGISEDEKTARLYLKNVLAVKKLSYSCVIKKRGGKEYKVFLEDMVRAYAVIKQLADSFVKEKQQFSDYLPDICLMIEKDEMAEAFVNAGIQKKQAQVLIKALKYENYKDIYDTPLIWINKKILLIPSVVKNIDIAQVVLSCVNEFHFRGEAFENQIISMLQKAGIRAMAKKFKDETGQYQCDVLFGIKKTLFICECKAWGEPRSMFSYYERNEKCFCAFRQLNRIAEKYGEMKEQLSKELDMKDGIIRIKKIVLLSDAVGIENMIDDMYFTDYSSFSLFIERKAPSVNMYHNGTMYYYRLPDFSEFMGKVTENKLLKYIQTPSAVRLMIKNTEKQKREMEILKLSLEYDTYILKGNNQLMPDQNAYEFLDNIQKIYELK